MRVATRSSALALAQAGQVAEALGQKAELVKASNDPPPETNDKERFTRSVERMVLEGGADAAVHSAKDLPGEMTAGLSIAAVPARVDPRDAWIGPGESVAGIPAGTRVGTASLRRRAQLKALRPDLEMVELRGNVDTRLEKLRAGEVDALVLAMAGLERLGRSDVVSFAFDESEMTPAAGQGALVVQTRTGRESEVAEIGDQPSLTRLLAERAAVVGLNTDCSSPVGIHARIDGDWLVLQGFAGRSDGSIWIRDQVEGRVTHPEALGRTLAARMLRAGATEAMAGSTLSE